MTRQMVLLAAALCLVLGCKETRKSIGQVRLSRGKVYDILKERLGTRLPRSAVDVKGVDESFMVGHQYIRFHASMAEVKAFIMGSSVLAEGLTDGRVGLAEYDIGTWWRPDLIKAPFSVEAEWWDGGNRVTCQIETGPVEGTSNWIVYIAFCDMPGSM